jgi:proton-dependent oligopeptide transporter, POT family
MQETLSAPADKSGLLLGHPKGLYVLFLTETWERFSYYGMRALLVLYLTQRFLLSDSRSFAIYGAYTALVYISPLLGGMIADRFFGYNRSVAVGAVLMIIGHFGFAIQDFHYAGTAFSRGNSASQGSLQFFYISMAFLITGVGFLKGNISTMVGRLYERESQLRDSGFVIFFWGVNIGATLAAFTCGYVGQTYGWGYGFGLAGLGMCAGLATFLLGQRYLQREDRPRETRALEIFGIPIPRRVVPIAAILATFLLSWGLMQRAEITGYIVVGTVAAAFAWTIRYSIRHMDKVERERVWCALIIWAMWACYAALIEQTGSSLNLFAARLVELRVGGLQIQASQLQGATTLFLLVLSPFFAWFWVYLDRHKLNPATPPKLCLAIFALAAGFGVLVLGTLFPDLAGKVSVLWLFLTYGCFAIAALILQPIGLSTVTRLTADRIVGFMVGLWMLAVAIGSYAAAQIAKLSSLNVDLHQSVPGMVLLTHYRNFFSSVGISALALALGFSALTPVMRKWMHGMR